MNARSENRYTSLIARRIAMDIEFLARADLSNVSAEHAQMLSDVQYKFLRTLRFLEARKPKAKPKSAA